MAKDKERRNGYIFYVQMNMTAKESAQRCGVTEKTFGDWVAKYHWKEERDARNASPGKRINNIKEIISNYSDEWLKLDRQIKLMESDGSDPEKITELRSRIKSIDDAVSKWNKTLENVEKENIVPLATYLIVMEDIFQAIMKYNSKTYMDLVDFQEQHLSNVSERLG